MKIRRNIKQKKTGLIIKTKKIQFALYSLVSVVIVVIRKNPSGSQFVVSHFFFLCKHKKEKTMSLNNEEIGEDKISEHQTIIQKTINDTKFIRLLFVNEWRNVISERMQNLEETYREDLINIISEQLIHNFPITPVYIMYNTNTKALVVSETQELQTTRRQKHRRKGKHKKRSPSLNLELICVILLGPQTTLKIREIKNECQKQHKQPQEHLESLIQLGKEHNCLLWVSSLMAQKIVKKKEKK